LSKKRTGNYSGKSITKLVAKITKLLIRGCPHSPQDYDRTKVFLLT